ncbi:hypothetical protein FB451DRAFT_404819 [Mycena latifolia]|nr:hypothetical protein FB451DRAFT_404819 [Mycena latifolia]
MKCDNKNCPSAAHALKLMVCTGCFSANYCSKECQTSSWSSHKQACKLHPPPSLSGIRLRVAPPEEKYNGNFEESDDEESEFSAKKIINVKIEHTEADKTLEVGYIKIQVIELAITRRFGFFDCLDEYSHELAKLALQFDHNGYLNPNSGCWRPADFRKEGFLVYLEELVIEPEWRGRGLGTWLLPKLFHLDELKGSNFIFTWPTVLGHLWPPNVNGPFGLMTPAEQAAWETKRDLIIKFFQEARLLPNIDADVTAVLEINETDRFFFSRSQKGRWAQEH